MKSFMIVWAFLAATKVQGYYLCDFTPSEMKFMLKPMNSAGTFEPLVWAVRANAIMQDRAGK